MDEASPQRRGGLESLWRRVLSLPAQPAFRVVVFGVALVLFYWPFLTADTGWSGREMNRFFFLAWGVVIFLTLLIGLSLPGSRRGRGGQPKD
jgi:hypothetical protein